MKNSNDVVLFLKKRPLNHHWQIIDTNHLAILKFGYNTTEFKSLNVKDIFITDIPDIFINVNRYKQPFHIKFCSYNKTKKGEIFPVEVTIHSFKFLFQFLIIASIRDNSDQEIIMNELCKERDLIALIMDTSPVGILLANKRGQITFANSHAEQLFRITKNEITKQNLSYLARNMSDFEGAPVPENELPFYWILNNEKPVYNVRIAFQLPDKINLLLFVSAAPLFDYNNDLTGMILVFDNVTDIFEAEKALKESEQKLYQSQKIESIGRLAGGIAHDFNNLLTTIMGYSDLILEEAADNNINDYVKEIVKSSKRATSLTQQLLAFSRKQLLRPIVFNINNLIQELEKMLKRLIGENIILINVLDTNISSIKADPVQIEQVIMNLIVNARDAMPFGGKVIIETENQFLDKIACKNLKIAKEGPYVLLTIKDTGIGMNEKTMKNIFEPFYTTKQRGKGTGLGLSTVYGIVKQSDGYIFVESKVNIGTQFTIHLPAVENIALQEKKLQPLPENPGGKETILLVEDEEELRNIVSNLIKRLGYTPITARNGLEALEIIDFHQGELDLLITDLIMPEMSGKELVEKILQKIPKLKILFISGYEDSVIENHGIYKENLAFLPKPFTIKNLSKKIRDILDN